MYMLAAAMKRGDSEQMRHDLVAIPQAISAKTNGASALSANRDGHGRFQTGNIGGPGRPKGSRNKLGEDFVAAIYEDWTAHGVAVLAQVRETNPTAYLRIIAALCPMHLNIRTDDQFVEMTAAELKQEILREMEELGLMPGAPESHRVANRNGRGNGRAHRAT
jgi:hypothetical protein